MALINCPKCGKTVSDKAKTCPHCGFSISSSTSSTSKENLLKKANVVSNSTKKIIWIILILGGVLLTWYGAYELSDTYYMRDETIWSLVGGIILVSISSYKYISLIHKCRYLHRGVITAVIFAILIPAVIKHQEIFEFEKKFCHLTSTSQLQNIYLKSRTTDTYIYFQGNDLIIKSGHGQILGRFGIRVDGDNIYDNIPLGIGDSDYQHIILHFSPYGGGYVWMRNTTFSDSLGSEWDVFSLKESDRGLKPEAPAPLAEEVAIEICADSVAIMAADSTTIIEAVVAAPEDIEIYEYVDSCAARDSVLEY